MYFFTFRGKKGEEVGGLQDLKSRSIILSLGGTSRESTSLSVPRVGMGRAGGGGGRMCLPALEGMMGTAYSATIAVHGELACRKYMKGVVHRQSC